MHAKSRVRPELYLAFWRRTWHARHVQRQHPMQRGMLARPVRDRAGANQALPEPVRK